MHLYLEDESDSMDGTSGTDQFETSSTTFYRDKIPSYFKRPTLGLSESLGSGSEERTLDNYDLEQQLILEDHMHPFRYHRNVEPRHMHDLARVRQLQKIDEQARNPALVPLGNFRERRERERRNPLFGFDSGLLDTFGFNGLSSTGNSSVSTEDSTDSTDLEIGPQFGLEAFDNNHLDGGRDFTGWFDETKDTAIVGMDVVGGSRSRIPERGWLNERWNAGFGNNSGDGGTFYDSDGSEGEGRFWGDIGKEHELSPMFPNYIDSVIPDIEDPDSLIYSKKVEVQQNHLRDNLYYRSQSYKMIMQFFPMFRTGN